MIREQLVKDNRWTTLEGREGDTGLNILNTDEGIEEKHMLRPLEVVLTFCPTEATLSTKCLRNLSIVDLDTC